MKKVYKVIIGLTMSVALLFGFLHTVWPEAVLSFEWLHIFLFNLLSGGALVIYYTEGTSAITGKVKLYFFLSIIYTFSAAARIYPLTLAISIPLFLVVEWVRIKNFSLFPSDFFRWRVPIHQKFNQASLLCLSVGIVFASLVILNNEYFHLVYYEKLTLRVFFLGYSFPISLIVMSIMFFFMEEVDSLAIRILKEISFWFVNVGVIVFFVFIIFEMLIFEIVVSSVLTVTVVTIFIIFLKTAPSVQQKSFLISGMTFLLFTAVTGVFYILKYFIPELEPYKDFVLTLHATVSLYGWNLSGLFIILRWNDFPIKLNSALIITLHWVIGFVLAPLGKYVTPVAYLAMPAYIYLLAVVLFGSGTKNGRSKVLQKG
jgi:hypothetical protein